MKPIKFIKLADLLNASETNGYPFCIDPSDCLHCEEVSCEFHPEHDG